MQPPQRRAKPDPQVSPTVPARDQSATRPDPPTVRQALIGSLFERRSPNPRPFCRRRSFEPPRCAPAAPALRHPLELGFGLPFACDGLLGLGDHKADNAGGPARISVY